MKSPSWGCEGFGYVESKYIPIHRVDGVLLQLAFLGWKEGKKGEALIFVREDK